MFKSKLLFAAIVAFSCITVTSHAQSFDWVSADIDVYDLKVIDVKRSKLRAHISGVGTRTFSVPSEFRFFIDGEPTPLAGLSPKQKLKAYVLRTRRGTLQLVDAGPVKAVVPEMPAKRPIIAKVVEVQAMAALPKTGTVFPLTLGLALGGGMLAFGLRRRRAQS